MRVVIVDDEPLIRERLRSLLSAHPDATLIAECQDGAEAVETLRQRSPDLVFLDIRMPELNGFEVLDALPPGNQPAVVFVTAFDQYAITAFARNAVDYLLKPIDPARFDEALERQRSRLNALTARRGGDLAAVLAELRRSRDYATRLVVRNGSVITFVPVADVDWIDAYGNYARLHVGSATHLMRESMERLINRLDPDRFLRIHRSTIVNTDRISRMEPYFHGEFVLTLRDGTRLISSRTRSAKLRDLSR